LLPSFYYPFFDIKKLFFACFEIDVTRAAVNGFVGFRFECNAAFNSAIAAIGHWHTAVAGFAVYSSVRVGRKWYNFCLPAFVTRNREGVTAAVV